jgi:DNA-binding transcriptional regulator of glucitol operon
MSLKFFHIVFVTITTLLSFAGAGWEWNNYRMYGGLHSAGAAVLALFGVMMIIYGVYFWKKARRLIL